MLQKRQPALAKGCSRAVTFQQLPRSAWRRPAWSWAGGFATPARVLARTRGEEVLAQRVAGTQPVEVTIRLDRFSAQVDTDWRLVWLGWPFEITAIAVDELAAVVTLIAVRSREVESVA